MAKVSTPFLYTTNFLWVTLLTFILLLKRKKRVESDAHTLLPNYIKKTSIKWQKCYITNCYKCTFLWIISNILYF